MRLAHLSDIHVLDLQGVGPHRFLNKRITGGLNLLLHRSKTHSEALLEDALETIEGLHADHVLVTGDLTNLALDTEFARAKRILEAHVPSGRLSVIAGNHDRYTLGATVLRRFEKHFRAYIQTDLPGLTQVRGWPYVKLLDDHVALIGVNTGVAQPILVSGGRVGAAQRRALAEALAHPEVKRRFVVVAQHHHLFKPAHKKREFPRGLFDKEAVKDVLVAGDADLVVHGHNHHYTVETLTKVGGKVLVCEAGSTTVAHYEDDVRAGKFNLYEIDETGLVEFTTYIYRPGEGFVPWKTWELAADSTPVERSA